MKTLDVGCGMSKHKGAVGIDIADIKGVDIVHDLNSYPWPLDSNQFELIIMDDIIEHLEEPLKAMEEAHRLLQKGGKVFMRIVHWNHRFAFSDPTHIRFFTAKSIDFLTGVSRPYYTTARFQRLKLDYIYDRKITKLIRSRRLLNLLGYYLNNVIQGMVVLLEKVEIQNNE